MYISVCVCERSVCERSMCTCVGKRVSICACIVCGHAYVCAFTWTRWVCACKCFSERAHTHIYRVISAISVHASNVVNNYNVVAENIISMAVDTIDG